MGVAYRKARGKVVATALDVTCALECHSYQNNGIPLFDYHFVLNMHGWRDTDRDNIFDRNEHAFVTAATDNDGASDYRDIDTDADGIIDATEAGDSDPDTAPVDTDSDGTPDFRDKDSDGDSIDDSVENAVDVDKDGAPDTDVDSDGKMNHVDTDADGDGNLNSVEGVGDVDGDGVPSFADADDSDGPLSDADGDTIINGEDNCPDHPNTDQGDADGDGVGDVCDDVDTPPTDGGVEGSAGGAGDGSGGTSSAGSAGASGGQAGAAGSSASDSSESSSGVAGCGCSIRKRTPSAAWLILLLAVPWLRRRTHDGTCPKNHANSGRR